MDLRVQSSVRGHGLVGAGDDVELVNRFLDHLTVRNFSVATRRAYAYDLLNFLRFLDERQLGLAALVPADVFEYLDWQAMPPPGERGRVVARLNDRRGAAPATLNRRIAAVRGLFEFAVMVGVRAVSPVPSPRRSSGLRVPRGLLGHVRARRKHARGRLMRQPRLLPESLPLGQVEAFLADLGTSRDRAMVLLMLLGGLRSAEARGLLLRDVDMGRRQVWVVGKGGRERVVPVEWSVPGFEPPVSVVVAGLGLAAAGLALLAAWCVTRESLGPEGVPFPGSVRAAWSATSTRSFIVMA